MPLLWIPAQQHENSQLRGCPYCFTGQQNTKFRKVRSYSRRIKNSKGIDTLPSLSWQSWTRVIRRVLKTNSEKSLIVIGIKTQILERCGVIPSRVKN
jgi:hypothetical protein